MKGHKRYRAGAWRLVVFSGRDPLTSKRIDIHETVRAPDNRAGSKLADARLAEIIAAVESGQELDGSGPRRDGVTFVELAERWQQANRSRRNGRTGEWVGWSPKTAKTNADNFRMDIFPRLGRREATAVTGVELDDRYAHLEDERGLSPSVAKRCHSQIRAMYNWAVRKKLLTTNPAIAADPPKVKPGLLRVPSMAEVRGVMELATPGFAIYIQIAATVGSRRGTMVALRWGNIDFDAAQITFERAIAESQDGLIEKGTKADRPYVVSLGPSSVAALTEHRTRSIENALRVGVEFGPRSFVFSDDGGATHWSLSWPTHAWKRYACKTGLTDIRLHDLRHTAASQMLMAGVPISIVAERLGCTEANILRSYRHFIPGSDRSAAELMDQMLDGAAPGQVAS